MKIMHIEAKSDVDVKKAVEKAVDKLPNKVGLVATIQFKHKLKDIKELLEEKGKKAVIGGQILGCDVSAAEKIKDKVDTFLYIGSGNFHPLSVALETGKKVVTANPLTNEVGRIKKKDIEKYKKQQRGALIKFLSSKKIGILVSTKPGQERMKKALYLKKKLEAKGKECYIFLDNTLNPAEFENFPFIECWINTACPRFADEKKGVINYEKVEEEIKRMD
ncbi:hypothetical protein GF361_02295 [Candidatus Woesearchaeota archaeon]|nr:hypothetical protein [Candidatus Woesearchaeota archaeon]